MAFLCISCHVVQESVHALYDGFEPSSRSEFQFGRWMPIDPSGPPGKPRVSKHVRFALSLHLVTILVHG
eukprot:4747481-Amphidinium_carterae.1